MMRAKLDELELAFLQVPSLDAVLVPLAFYHFVVQARRSLHLREASVPQAIGHVAPE